MQCKSLWIKASAKCINVNVNVNILCKYIYFLIYVKYIYVYIFFLNISKYILPSIYFSPMKIHMSHFKKNWKCIFLSLKYVLLYIYWYMTVESKYIFNFKNIFY